MIRYLGIGVAASILFALLGAAVSHAPPDALDDAGRVLDGSFPQAALVFTASCWWYVLATYGLIGVGVAVRAPAWRERIVTSLLVTLVSWQVSDALKAAFHRPRPAYWRVIHETSFSYPSGHAMFATIVYVLWAYFVWKSDLPRAVRFAVPPLLVLWAAGILWSRLALGAHYVTDLFGGILLGIGALSFAVAIRAAAALRVRRFEKA